MDFSIFVMKLSWGFNAARYRALEFAFKRYFPSVRALDEKAFRRCPNECANACPAVQIGEL
jgi:hypothetical protein